MTEPSTPTGPADATESTLVRAKRSVAALLPRWGEWKPAAGAPAADLLAGLIVALVALPLALGFGISSGLGAAAGLTTAVIAGAMAAVFGGSRFSGVGPDRCDDRGAGAHRRAVRADRGPRGRADRRGDGGRLRRVPLFRCRARPVR
nr:hypothetical protein GCM10017611_78220 [Rhodococcus wratislaviensis]